MDALSLIRRHPALQRAERPHAQRLAAQSEVRHLPEGAAVLTVGLPCEHVLLIGAGSMVLHRKNRAAKTQILQGIVTAPSLFGDVELYAGSPWWAVSARTLEPSTIVFMPREAWDAFAGAQLAVAAALYREASARHMLSIQLVQIFALQKTENKILRLIKELADGDPPVAKLSQIDLARALGLNPKTIARNLDALEAGGLIRRDGEQVEVLSKDPVHSLEGLGTFGTGTTWRLPRKR
jgi:CRP-like cAMP-binding protein